MKDNPFNYVAAFAAIVSLILAFTPYFPRHKNYIRYAAIFFLGMLVGSVCASLLAEPATIFHFQLGIPPMWLLGAAVVVVIIAIIVILVMAS